MSQNSIEIISVTLAAGESRLFAVTGDYFEVIDAPSPIDIVLSDYNGAQRGRLMQASASFYSKGVEFGVVQITSASAQTVRFAYGSGETGTRRATGSVTISGAVALDAATLAALESIDLNSATLQTLTRPQLETGNWKDTGALIANTPLTVFTPASNPNGTILLSAFSTNQCNTAIASECFIHKSSPPTSITDGSIVLAGVMHSISPSCVISGQLPSAQIIPPGSGLYFITNVSNSAGNNNWRGARFRQL